ncbi:MAG: hypothetical protein ACJA1A_001451 [Saprospiraceae bacterium]|jgi:hypothetical protein|tara:strand:+ start:318 stop:554 length:237 start_codon:yes stop_codon:yes gene_type:complete
MCNISEVSCQKLYKTTWKQSTFIVGGSATLLGGGILSENRKGVFTAQDITVLKRDEINEGDHGTVEIFLQKLGCIVTI